MAKIDVYAMNGQVVGSMELSDAIFGIEPNHDVMHRVVVNQLANRRQGTHKTKGRSEVSGGGRKPYRQKGTGRARQGSIRAAQHVGGGVIFGPVPRDYSYTLPKKMRRLALKSALSAVAQGAKMKVLDKLELNEAKTKEMATLLKNLKLERSTLLVLSERDEKTALAARNILGLKTSLVNTINVYDLLRFDDVVMTKDAVAKIEEVYA